MSVAAPPPDYKVELPAGGFLPLQTADEVEFWQRSAEKYKEEYTLSKQNDLIALGQLLQQQVILYRAQLAMNGMEPELNAQGVPTGNHRRIELNAGEVASWQKTMTAASTEIRNLEKSLGIDKATREQGGAHTVDSYVRTLKRAAHQRGVHIAKRTEEYERVINELRVRIRLLYFGDEEDRKYHNINPKSILDWLKDETDRLADVDQKFNREKGKLYRGQL